MGSSSAIAHDDGASPTESAAPSGSTADSAAAESATTTTGADPDPSSGSSAMSPTDPTSPQATTAGGTTADDDGRVDQSEGTGGAAGDGNADDTNAADVTPNTEVDDGADPGLQDSGLRDDDLPPAEPCVVDHGGQTPSLSEYYADYFALGTAIDAQYNQYSDTIVEHFNSLTAENEMKFDALQPTEGNFTFNTADQMIALARSNGMQVRGHALVWHNQTPSGYSRGRKSKCSPG